MKRVCVSCLFCFGLSVKWCFKMLLYLMLCLSFIVVKLFEKIRARFTASVFVLLLMFMMFMVLFVFLILLDVCVIFLFFCNSYI